VAVAKDVDRRLVPKDVHALEQLAVPATVNSQ
jgi:hypothetical protein